MKTKDISKPTIMKTKFYAASKSSIPSNETMTVIITDSENVKREYGSLAIDVCNADFADIQKKEHAELYGSEILKIEVLTYKGKRFKTIAF